MLFDPEPLEREGHFPQNKHGPIPQTNSRGWREISQICIWECVRLCQFRVTIRQFKFTKDLSPTVSWLAGKGKISQNKIWAQILAVRLVWNWTGRKSINAISYECFCDCWCNFRISNVSRVLTSNLWLRLPQMTGPTSHWEYEKHFHEWKCNSAILISEVHLLIRFKIAFRSLQQSWNREEPFVRTNRAILYRVPSIHHNSIFPETPQNQCYSIVACGLKLWQRSASKCDQKSSDIASEGHWLSKAMTSHHPHKIHDAIQVFEIVERSTRKTFTRGVISQRSLNCEIRFHPRTKVSN
jgi:hypothetical protein